MKLIRGIGELLITFGLVLLLFCAYELWGTGLYTQREQQRLSESLEQRWDTKPVATPKKGRINLATARFSYPRTPEGRSFAILWIPELGHDYNFAVIQGAGPEQLKKGPGHYLGADGTAMPGQRGNFVLSGHRTTYMAPFKEIDELEPGDPIVVETDDTWFTYRVRNTDIVSPSTIEVTAPVPYHPERRPRRRMITLTTCHPMYTARQRLVVFGELTRAERKSAGRPLALAGEGSPQR